MDHHPAGYCFIVSTGRTGTQALARYLDAQAGVRAYHEPWPSRPLRIAANAYRAGSLSQAAMVRFLRWALGHGLSRTDGTTYVISCPYLRACAELLPRVFPGASLIHIVRNPYTYIPSYLNHGVFHGVKGLVARRVPMWLLKPEHLEAEPLKHWVAMSPIEAVAWRWQALNNMIEAAYTAFPDRYLRLRFEDLFENDQPALRDLALWLGLPNPEALMSASEQRHNATRARRHGPASQWSAEEVGIVSDYCGELMTKYGYPLPEEPR